MIDLHLHTYFSDGLLSPAQVLQQAAALGVSTIALTDHDNANGARQALPLAPEFGVELIPAIELTTSWPGLQVSPDANDIDLLGYFVDLSHPGFIALEQAVRQDISQRLADCGMRLQAIGLGVSLEEILVVNPRFPSVGSMIEVIQARGTVGDWGQCYQIVIPVWRQVRLSRLEIEHAIRVIHAVGGVAVLAHPARVKVAGGLLQAAEIEHLARMGLDGLEIYHPAHDEGARQHFLRLAQQADLLTSGGTDDHGRRGTPIGMPGVTPDMVEALRARHFRLSQEGNN